MKAYINTSGKGRWANFWGDKVPARLKRIFKKSARQVNKNLSKEK